MQCNLNDRKNPIFSSLFLLYARRPTGRIMIWAPSVH